MNTSDSVDGKLRPSWCEFRIPFVVYEWGVKWLVFKPDVLDSDQPYIDGPYCPKCDKKLEEQTEGHLFKKNLWLCPKCKEKYAKPKDNLKEQVKKTFNQNSISFR
jgi:ribosomal protein L37AE/L43A